MLTFVQLHGLGTEQITVRVDRLDEALMDDGTLGVLYSQSRDECETSPGLAEELVKLAEELEG